MGRPLGDPHLVTPPRPGFAGASVMVAALVLMMLMQAVASDWTMVVVLACTAGFILTRERTYRRDRRPVR